MSLLNDLCALYGLSGPRVVCAWCGKVMEEGDEDGPVSHGICPECAAKTMAEFEAFKTQQEISSLLGAIRRLRHRIQRSKRPRRRS